MSNAKPAPKRQFSGFMPANVRSVSSPALLDPNTAAPTNGTVLEENELEHVPSCDLVLDLLQLKDKKALCDAVLGVTQTVLPEWARDVTEVQLERASGALTNAVFFVSAANKPKLLLRIYGIGCESVVDRQNELAWLARLAPMATLGPQVLASFGNGRFEEYLESTTLTHADIQDAQISCQIAEALRHLHNVTDIYPPSENCRLEVWRNITQYFTHLLELSSRDPHWADLWKRLELDQLPAQIEQLKKHVAKYSVIVFAHNDTQYGNVLRMQQSGELVIVDFEYAGYNPRGFDIANHFTEWMYNYHCDRPHHMHAEYFPTREERLRFATAYLEAGENSSQITPEALLEEVEPWVMATLLHWALWGLIQATQSEIDFDYMEYATERLVEFRKRLSEVQ